MDKNEKKLRMMSEMSRTAAMHSVRIASTPPASGAHDRRSGGGVRQGGAPDELLYADPVGGCDQR